MTALKATILALPLLVALSCGSGEDRAPEDWSAIFAKLPAALMSVWGTSADDIWTAGADPGDGLGPLVIHFDGAKWKELSTGHEGDIWWVFGFPRGPVFFGGENGLVLRYEDGAFERMKTPGTATVYGIWGVAPDDLWATGGNVTSGAFAWRFDGSSWTEVADFPSELADSESMFKVWGRSNDDVWLVGTSGTIVRYDGKRFTHVSSGTTKNLFTVHGDDARAVAVGGSRDGVIVEEAGSGWREVTPSKTPHVLGVWLAGEEGYAVGAEGSVFRHVEGEWKRVRTGMDLAEAFHSVWVDPDGGVWAVGGQVLAPPLVDGIMIHRRPGSGRD